MCHLRDGSYKPVYKEPEKIKINYIDTAKGLKNFLRTKCKKIKEKKGKCKNIIYFYHKEDGETFLKLVYNKDYLRMIVKKDWEIILYEENGELLISKLL